MSIVDLIATGKEAEQLVAQKDSLTQQVADLQNQIDTANLQHGNDQQEIKDLQQKLDAANIALAATEAQLAQANKLLDSDAAMIEKQALDIHQAQMQLVQMNSVKVYDGLEFLPWALNTKAEVGGSGLGTGGSKLPGIEMAELWVNPDAPVAPVTTNYFDGYFTQDKPLDDTLTRFHVETLFMLPTQADVDACQCLEMESRQVLTGGLMFVWATQLYFSGNKFRYWGGPQGKWIDSGTLCPKFTPGKFYHVEVAGHRDAAYVSHDYIAINGVKVDLTGTKYAAYNLGWKQMNRCALQIDGKESATPTMCKVKIGNTKFTVSQ